jgi:hypothetical protein
MSIDLSNYEERIHQAVKYFWVTRESSFKEMSQLTGMRQFIAALASHVAIAAAFTGEKS